LDFFAERVVHRHHRSACHLRRALLPLAAVTAQTGGKTRQLDSMDIRTIKGQGATLVFA
jgi:hypothetical protein